MVGVEEMTDFRDSGQFSCVRCEFVGFGILQQNSQRKRWKSAILENRLGVTGRTTPNLYIGDKLP